MPRESLSVMLLNVTRSPRIVRFFTRVGFAGLCKS